MRWRALALGVGGIMAGACFTPPSPSSAPDADARLLSCLDETTLHDPTPGVGTVACPLGCANDPIPHCQVPVPAHQVPWAVTDQPLAAATWTAVSYVLNTDDGTIESSNGSVRGAGLGIDDTSGLYFALFVDDTGRTMGVFAFRSWTVGNATSVTLVGSRSAVILVREDALIEGDVLASAAYNGLRETPGPGGGAGATSSLNAIGCGGLIFGGGAQDGLSAGSSHGGGGGGGNAGTGAPGGGGEDLQGDGGDGCDVGRNGFVGGGGGGRGTGLSPGTDDVGGGGGGALQITAGGTITISGRVLASGGGGAGGNRGGGGSGGGAGGTLWLEAAQIDGPGGIFANGGGGGGGSIDPASPGQPGAYGPPSQMPAQGGLGAGSAGRGGNGGALIQADPGVGDTIGGGGGGAPGIIVLRLPNDAFPTALTTSPLFETDGLPVE